MSIHRIIRRRIRRQDDGVNFVGDVSAVISANVGTGSSRSHVFTRSTQRIVQRSGRMHTNEERETKQGGSDSDAAGGAPEPI